MRRPGRARRLALVFLAALACAEAAADDGSTFPVFDGAGLEHGRTVWLGTCRNCHATGFADAPAVTDFINWSPRLAQARETLYDHALNGFYGADYAHMPPRGGNAALSDEDVTHAVDYMVTLVRHYNQENSK